MSRPETETQMRRGMAADAPAVADLSRAAYDKYEGRLGYRPIPAVADYDEILARDRVWLLEAAGGRLVGALVLVAEADHLLIYSVAVAPGHQGCGHGRRLMAWAERQAEALGLPEIRLYTNERMTENIVFYTALGYRKVARRAHPSRPGSWLMDMAKTL